VSGQDPTGLVTALLNQWQRGDTASFERLSALIYSELHRIAEGYLRRSPQDTLQPTALVHEAYLRLAGQNASYRDRKHFFALAARAMRHVLVDHARARKAEKRGGGQENAPLDEAQAGTENRLEEFLILDEALNRLAREEPRLAQIVELRYFSGLTGVEIAEVVGISESQVSREGRLAEAWLKRTLAGG
jgi:RNA polymerase sigma factor (TIGR02999 family)